MRTVGEILREVMEAKGLSQGQVFLKTGVSQSAICNLLQGKRQAPGPRVIVALAEGLGLDPVELLYAAAGREPPDRPHPPLPPHLAALSELLGDDNLRRLAQSLRKLPPEKRQAVIRALWAVIETAQ